MASYAIPNEFMCPITMVLMKDPVLATDGYTYEKEAIQHWLRSNTISPMTREPLRMDNCRPNRALRDAIERWEKESKSASKKNVPKTKPRHPRESSPPPSAPTSSPNYGTTIEADHLYAIMVQTQETVEQIKRSTPTPAPAPSVQPQHVQRQLTEEQKKKYAMAMCFLFTAIIILIFVVDRIQTNMSSN